MPLSNKQVMTLHFIFLYMYAPFVNVYELYIVLRKTNHIETQLTINLVDYNSDYSEHKSKIRNLYYCITLLGILM